MRTFFNSILLLCLVLTFLAGCNSDSKSTDADANLTCPSSQQGLEYLSKTSAAPAISECDGAPITVEGRIDVRFALDDVNGESYEYRLTTDDGERYKLIFSGPIPDYQTDERIEATGALTLCDPAASDKILLIQTSSRVAAMLTTAALSGVTGDQRTAVILVSFSDQQTTDTIATAQNVVFNSVNNFWRENSFNQTSISGDAFGPYTIAVSKTGCDSDAIATAAKAAAAAAGVDLSRYTRHVFSFPKNGCTWYGLGTIGGSPSKAWLNNALTKFTTAHELGHNLGLYHANAHDCGSATLGTTCTKIEYGDTTDVMGNRLAGHYNAFQKERLGWITPTLITGSGTYTISPYEMAGSGPLALKILKSSTTSAKTYYYLEYRQPNGSDSVLAGSTYNLTKGIVVHTGSTSSGNTSLLLNMNPQLGSWYKAALTVGQTFTDSEAGVSLTLASLDAGGATLNISIGGGSGPVPTPVPTPTPAPTPTPRPTPTPAPNQLVAAVSMTRVNFKRGETIEIPIAIRLGTQAVAGATYRLTMTAPSGLKSEIQGLSETGTISVHSFRAGSCSESGNYVATVSASYSGKSATNTITFSVE